MQILVNTDHHIEGHEALASWVKSVIEQSLAAVSARVTRVTVHLSGENTNKNPGVNDMRCVLEAHLAGRTPFAVTEHGTTIHDAVIAANDKLSRLVGHTLERLADRGDAVPHRP